jgi:hypothetical protein
MSLPGFEPATYLPPNLGTDSPAIIADSFSTRHESRRSNTVHLQQVIRPRHASRVDDQAGTLRLPDVVPHVASKVLRNRFVVELAAAHLPMPARHLSLLPCKSVDVVQPLVASFADTNQIPDVIVAVDSPHDVVSVDLVASLAAVETLGKFAGPFVLVEQWLVTNWHVSIILCSSAIFSLTSSSLDSGLSLSRAAIFAAVAIAVAQRASSSIIRRRVSVSLALSTSSDPLPRVSDPCCRILSSSLPSSSGVIARLPLASVDLASVIYQTPATIH